MLPKASQPIAASVNTEWRLLELGVCIWTAHRDGWRWHILADLDGNEFCREPSLLVRYDLVARYDAAGA